MNGCILTRITAWYCWLQSGCPSRHLPLFLLTLQPLNCPVTRVGGHIATHDSTSTHLAALEVQPLFFGGWVSNGRMAEQLEILNEMEKTVLQMNTHNAIMNQNMNTREHECTCTCICWGAETSVGVKLGYQGWDGVCAGWSSVVVVCVCVCCCVQWVLFSLVSLCR